MNSKLKKVWIVLLIALILLAVIAFATKDQKFSRVTSPGEIETLIASLILYAITIACVAITVPGTLVDFYVRVQRQQTTKLHTLAFAFLLGATVLQATSYVSLKCIYDQQLKRYGIILYADGCPKADKATLAALEKRRVAVYQYFKVPYSDTAYINFDSMYSQIPRRVLQPQEPTRYGEAQPAVQPIVAPFFADTIDRQVLAASSAEMHKFAEAVGLDNYESTCEGESQKWLMIPKLKVYWAFMKSTIGIGPYAACIRNNSTTNLYAFDSSAARNLFIVAFVVFLAHLVYGVWRLVRRR
jgi:hypothetical protein